MPRAGIGSCATRAHQRRRHSLFVLKALFASQEYVEDALPLSMLRKRTAAGDVANCGMGRRGIVGYDVIRHHLQLS